MINIFACHRNTIFPERRSRRAPPPKITERGRASERPRSRIHNRIRKIFAVGRYVRRFVDAILSRTRALPCPGADGMESMRCCGCTLNWRRRKMTRRGMCGGGGVFPAARWASFPARLRFFDFSPRMPRVYNGERHTADKCTFLPIVFFFAISPRLGFCGRPRSWLGFARLFLVARLNGLRFRYKARPAWPARFRVLYFSVLGFGLIARFSGMLLNATFLFW